MKEKKTLAILARAIARIGITVTGTTAFGFALLSGTEGFSGGVFDLVKNCPNAAPWVVLLLLAFYAWKNELLGGIGISIFGLAATAALVVSSANFFISTFFLTSLISVLGFMFIISWYLSK
jgi:predicted exporter